jgi:hypothetical protein
VQIFHLRQVHVSLACDGLGALQRLFAYDRPAALTDSQWDMVRTVQQVMEAMPYLTIEWHHVRGHQDDPRDSTEPTILDIWAQWNILADIRAKHTRCHVQHIPVIPFMTGIPSVVLENIPSVTDSIESIRNHCLIPRAHEYWAQLRATQGKELMDSADTDWD